MTSDAGMERFERLGERSALCSCALTKVVVSKIDRLSIIAVGLGVVGQNVKHLRNETHS